MHQVSSSVTVGAQFGDEASCLLVNSHPCPHHELWLVTERIGSRVHVPEASDGPTGFRTM